MNISKHLDMNPKIMRGKPIMRGTWIPAELILRKLGEGAMEKVYCFFVMGILNNEDI